MVLWWVGVTLAVMAEVSSFAGVGEDPPSSGASWVAGPGASVAGPAEAVVVAVGLEPEVGADLGVDLHLAL